MEFKLIHTLGNGKSKIGKISTDSENFIKGDTVEQGGSTYLKVNHGHGDYSFKLELDHILNRGHWVEVDSKEDGYYYKIGWGLLSVKSLLVYILSLLLSSSVVIKGIMFGYVYMDDIVLSISSGVLLVYVITESHNILKVKKNYTFSIISIIVSLVVLVN